jgi:Tfp pilus assembly protein FimT
MDWHKLASDVLTPVLQGLAVTLAAMAVAALKQWMKKQGIDIEQKQLAVEAQKFSKERAIAESAVLQAEEHVESKAAGEIDKGTAKMDHAVEVILQQVPDVTTEHAEALAKEAVARVGLGATAKAKTGEPVA